MKKLHKFLSANFCLIGARILSPPPQDVKLFRTRSVEFSRVAINLDRSRWFLQPYLKEHFLWELDDPFLVSSQSITKTEPEQNILLQYVLIMLPFICLSFRFNALCCTCSIIWYDTRCRHCWTQNNCTETLAAEWLFWGRHYIQKTIWHLNIKLFHIGKLWMKTSVIKQNIGDVCAKYSIYH